MPLTSENIVAVPGMLSRWVRLPSGVKAHYMTSGEDGPAIVLIHGGLLGSSGTAGWRYMAPFLGQQGFRVYCPDMPSFGITSGPLDEYAPGFSGFVDFIQEFTTALCLDKFYIGGNSMGCSTSLMYMVAHPERVLGAAVIAGNIGDLLHVDKMREVDTRPEGERPNMSNWFDGTTAAMRSMMEQLVVKKETMPDDLVEMRTLSARKTEADYNRQVGGAVDEYNGRLDVNTAARLRMRGRLETMDIPVVYVYGREDVVDVVEAGYLQEDLLPNFQFFYPENTGHQAQTDSPAIINALFLEFFRDGKVSRDTAIAAGVSDRRPVHPHLVDL